MPRRGYFARDFLDRDGFAPAASDPFLPESGAAEEEEGPDVPTDGPDGVYVPTTDEHWTALEIAVPTLCYPCQEASGDLEPSIGEVTLTANASPLYAQAVTGWTRTFVGTQDTAAVQGFSTTDGTFSLGAGESAAFLVYMSAAVAAGTARLFNVVSHSWALQMAGSGALSVRFANVGTAGSAAHEGIGTIRPYLWVRDAAADTCRLYTTIEQVNGTHSEIAVNNTAGAGLGALTGGVAAEARYGLLAYWKGADAETIGKATLTALGWTLAY